MTAPCLGNSTPYDILIDDTRGPAFHAALDEARRICGRCPLAHMQACFKTNRDEQWVRAIVGVTKTPSRHNTCGKPWGHKAHARHGEATCEDCRVADADAKRARSRRRKAELDPARIERRMAGEPGPVLNAREAAEVIRRMYALGHSLADIRRITKLHPERYWKVDELKREVAA